MKKFVAALLVLAMVLAMSSVGFAYNVKPLNEPIRMQFKKNATGYEKVTRNYGKKKAVVIKKGSAADAVATKGDWYQIAIPGRKNGVDLYWFNKKYLKAAGEDVDYKLIFSSGGSGRSRVDEEKTGEGQADGLKNMTVKTSGKVNMRSTASLKGGSKGTIKKGKKVKLTGKYGYDTCGVLFVQVKYNGKTNYISAEYIKSSDVKKIKAKLPTEDEGE